MSVTGTITKSINVTNTIDDTIDIPSVNTVSGSSSFPSLTQTITDGTAAGQANKMYRSYRNVGASSSETLDLTSLTNFHGDAVAFTGIKSLTIAIISPDGTKKLTVGNAASNSFQGPLSSAATVDIYYDHEFKNWSAGGFTVDSTHKSLKVANAGASTVYYAILALGIG